ncbi:hypothetical protein OH77DRAFT_1407357 [Trametes cingulata]|nr:hypothetical protein OH77DRAFT_1407357 [Trametes cingulata]
MSLSSLARRFRRSRSNGNAPSLDQPLKQESADSSSRSGALPSRSANMNGGKDTSTATNGSTPQRSPQAHPILQMPIPSPTAACPNVPSAMQIPAMSVSSTSPNVMDGALAELAPLEATLDAGPTLPRSEKTINTLGEKIDVLVGQATGAVSALNAVQPVVTALEKTDIAQKIERGIQRFADDIPWLMKGLDELAKIHPAVTVAVLAFKAVYALETTRQENDRRVLTLYVEMKEMMMVMVQLRTVENRTHIGLDGRVLKDRLEDLAEKTARDIKDCANFCDAFLKKRLLVKVLKGPSWAEKLGSFVKTFADRKADFQFALAMHTASSLSEMKRQTSEINAKVDVVIALFERFRSSEELQLAEEVQSKGGAAKVRQNDEYLRSLIALDLSMRRGSAERDPPGAGRRDKLVPVRQRDMQAPIRKDGADYSNTLDDLKAELREDIDDALEKNFETFLGKFELQVSILQAALEKYIHAENDRVIGAVTDVVTHGPHMKIKDPELRKIWQDMNWRGNVKARLFVMTLREHYRDVFEAAPQAADDQAIVNDEWALEFLGPQWIQPIMEAFDDDASGYVTIAEVNKLMALRPSSLGWSLARWLAYWAVGWQSGASRYVEMIKTTLAQMRDLLPHVLPANRGPADSYLSNILGPTLMLVLALKADNQWPQWRFEDYVEHEEQRIRSNLEHVKYYIDASDTLSLVLGPGRLEKSVLPLLYLLLQEHHRRFEAAKRFVLADSELTNASQSMNKVFVAVQARFQQLRDLFEEQRLDLSGHFKKFACGLFAYNHSEVDFWSTENLTSDMFVFKSQRRGFLVDISGIEEGDNPMPDTTLYDMVDEDTEEDDHLAPTSVKSVLGLWNGFLYDDTVYPTAAMVSFRIHYSRKDYEDFKATGTYAEDGAQYEVSGQCIQEDGGTIRYEWTMTYAHGYTTHYYVGRLEDEYTLRGSAGPYSDVKTDAGSFILKRISAEHLCFYPSPKLMLSGRRPRELWHYAISAILHDVRRRNWTWAYFAARRDIRKGYLKLKSSLHRRAYTPDEFEELCRILQACTTKDARFYQSLVQQIDQTIPHHTERPCYAPTCWTAISGACVICLDCALSKERFDKMLLSFCDDPSCYNAMLRPNYELEFGHDSSHDFLKIRTILLPTEIPTLLRDAREGLAYFREKSYAVVPPDPPNPEQPDDESAVDTDACIAEQGHASEGPPVEGSGSSGTADVQQGFEETKSIQNPILSGRWCEPEDSSWQTGNEVLKFGAGPGEDTIASRVLTQDVDAAIGHEKSVDAASGEAEKPSWEAEVHSDGEPVVTDEVDAMANVGVPCKVCRQQVYMGACWYCLQCYNYVCNECDAKLLTVCESCKQPFPQPHWYCGTKHGDFVCPMCAAKGYSAPTADSWERRAWITHVGTHPMVQCKRQFGAWDQVEDDNEAGQVSMEERLAALEERMTAMDAKLERLQEVIVSKLDEALSRVMGRVGNGHAN